MAMDETTWERWLRTKSDLREAWEKLEAAVLRRNEHVQAKLGGLPLAEGWEKDYDAARHRWAEYRNALYSALDFARERGWRGWADYQMPVLTDYVDRETRELHLPDDGVVDTAEGINREHH